MLNETIFLFGAGVCFFAGLFLLAVLAAGGALAVDPFLAFPGLLFLLFGGVFFYTYRGARGERIALLRAAEEGTLGQTPGHR